MNYYFLASSLPTLSMVSPPEITFDEFLAVCEDHLSEDDAAVLSNISGSNREAAASSHPFIESWEANETVLKNTLTRLRAIKLNLDASVYTKETPHSDLYAEKAITDAYNHGSPLTREQTIDKLRWEQAEEQAGFNPFSADAIFAYGLKLKIAERWGSLDESSANASVTKIINKNPEEKE